MEGCSLGSQSLADADSEVAISSRRPLSLLASVFFHADAAAKQRSLFAPKELFHTLSKLYSDQQHIQILNVPPNSRCTWKVHVESARENTRMRNNWHFSLLLLLFRLRVVYQTQ